MATLIKMKDALRNTVTQTDTRHIQENEKIKEQKEKNEEQCEQRITIKREINRENQLD